MLNLFLTVLIVLALIIIGESVWRGAPGEASRKFIHIFVGCFVAFSPYWLSWRQIEILAAAFLLVILISRQFKLLKTISEVGRPSYGDILFAVAPLLLALINPGLAVFAASMLFMAVGDGLAAVIGTLWPAKPYRIMGAGKTVAGTATFVMVGLAILLGYSFWADVSLGWWVLVTLIAATAVENLSWRGSDNLVVPLVVAGLLLALT